MEISCSICRYGKSHDYLNRYYCNNKNCYQSQCFDQPETFNCPHGRPQRGLRRDLKIIEDKMTYPELREEISKLLIEFLNYELPIHNDGEFDFEYMETQTDRILHLIQRQGGTY